MHDLCKKINWKFPWRCNDGKLVQCKIQKVKQLYNGYNGTSNCWCWCKEKRNHKCSTCAKYKLLTPSVSSSWPEKKMCKVSMYVSKKKYCYACSALSLSLSFFRTCDSASNKLLLKCNWSSWGFLPFPLVKWHILSVLPLIYVYCSKLFFIDINCLKDFESWVRTCRCSCS